MDNTLLYFFNQTLAHPALDLFMAGVTTVGFMALPGLGLVLLLMPKHRKMGAAILAALAAGLVLTVSFQYAGYRPRPETVRLILPVPKFPSYPSGHAVAAFSVAWIIGLRYRQWRWWGIAVLGAILIAVSRLYLGHHYPSDIFGGAVLGAAIGAACYGIFLQPKPDWRWLLWPQVAIVIVVTQMAYLDLLSLHLLRWPWIDKFMHFLLFGAVVFWLNLWLRGQSMRVGPWAVPVAIVFPLLVAIVEEGAQSFSPLRSASFADLTSDLVGMLFFWWLSAKFLNARPIERDRQEFI